MGGSPRRRVRCRGRPFDLMAKKESKAKGPYDVEGHLRSCRSPEAPIVIEPMMEVLQTSALPLGYGAGASVGVRPASAEGVETSPPAILGQRDRVTADPHVADPRAPRGKQAVLRPALIESPGQLLEGRSRVSSRW